MDDRTPAPDPQPSLEPGPRAQRRARRDRTTRILLWGAGVLVLLFLAGSFLLSRFLDPDRLAGWLEPQLEAAVNRDVSVGAVKVGFLPVAVRLEDLSISDPTGLAPELAALGSLELRVRVLPLLRREVRVREIRLDGLVANLRVGPDGLSNFGDFSSQAEGEPVEAEPVEEARPFALQLDGIRLSGGSLSYHSAPDSLAFELRELEADAAVSREVDGPWIFDGRYAGNVSFAGSTPSAGALPSLEGVPLTLRMAAEAAEDFSSVTIREGTLALEEVQLAVSGEARDLKEPIRELQLALQARGVPLADVLALLPDSVLEARELSADGTLSADLAVRGPLGPDTIPAVQGTVEVTGGNVRMGTMALLEALEATVEVSEDRSVRPRARGRLLGGDLSVDGAASLGETPSMDLRVVLAPILDRVDPALLPEGVTVRGSAPGDLRVVGNPLEPASLRFWGQVGLRDFRGTHPGLGVPASVSTASLELSGNRATLAPSTVALGEDRVELQGTLLGLEGLMDGAIPEFQGSARGPRVNLVTLVAEPPPDTALTYGRVAFAKVGGRQVRGRTAEAAAEEMGLRRPARLPLAGEIRLALDTVIDRKGRMEAVDATLLFGPDFLQVTQATFQRYGGRISTVAALELGDDPEEPFTLNLQVENVDAGAFLGQTTPLGRAVTGRLNLDMDLAGALDGLLLPSRPTLQGSGSFSLTGGGLQTGALGERLASFLGIQALASPSVQDWSTAFVLRDGLVLLQESRVQGAPGNPTVGGGIGLDGGLDLVTAFDLPREQVGAAALERLGIPQGAGAMQTVAAVLRVGGSLSDPALRADPRAAVADVTEAVQERAREELQEEVQERREQLQERATGFLRGLLGGRDTTRAAPPPDTLRPDTIRPDTVRPDTTRPDTVRPDTMRADTTRPDTMVVRRR